MQDKKNVSLSDRQQGVALVVALVLLLIVTLLAFASIRGITLQEKMAGNTFDRAQAFQLTEGAVDLAARSILPSAAATNPNSYNDPGVTDCSAGPCADNPATDTATNYPWVPITLNTSVGGTSDIQSLVSLYDNHPDYLVQYMGLCADAGNGNFKFVNDQNNQGGGGSLEASSQCYRVTARSGAAAGRARIVLQAIYRVSS